MKKARLLGKQITYKFGYTNLTFDLWIVLHRVDYNTSMYHRYNYLNCINSAYKEAFTSMKDYKHQQNFKRCLGKLELNNVVNAIKRAKVIMQKMDMYYSSIKDTNIIKKIPH